MTAKVRLLWLASEWICLMACSHVKNSEVAGTSVSSRSDITQAGTLAPSRSNLTQRSTRPLYHRASIAIVVRDIYFVRPQRSFPPISDRRPGCARFRVEIGTSGKPLKVDLTQRSGNQEFDRAAKLEILRHSIFKRNSPKTVTLIYEYYPGASDMGEYGTPRPGCV